MAFCSGCGTQIPDGASLCPACAAKAPAATASTAGGMNDSLAGALCYFAIIAIVFLLIEPYNKNKFVRFHAFQSLFLAVAWIAVWFILAFIPVIGWILMPFAFLGFIILLVVLFIKAYQGQKFQVPYIGEMALKQAGE